MRGLGQAGGNANISAIGEGLSIAATAAKDLVENVKGTPAAVKIASNAVGGIASVAIDADTQRTLKSIEADKQRKLSTATSEEERARITQEAENRKAAAVESAEKRKAVILGLMEVAKAAASYPNIPEMAAHGVAAALYAGVAGGAFGSASGGGGAASPGGGGGFSDATSAASRDVAASGDGGVTVINNFNQPLVTQQQIGVASINAIRSTGRTGHAQSKGA